MVNSFSLMVSSMRPAQWTKNVTLFVALVFSQNLLDLEKVLLAFAAYIIFILLSGGVYLFNDLMDLDEDREHPEKRMRPIASGELSVRLAKVLFVILVVAALFLACLINSYFALLAAGYLLVQVAYSVFLRQVVVVDVLCIAAGFGLRIIAGGAAISVPISWWLLLCTFLISLFIALCKRRHEYYLTKESGRSYRGVLRYYSPDLLSLMIGVVSVATVIAYSFYTISPETFRKFGTENLKFTIPFVIYGIYRYAYLVYRRNKGGRPELHFLFDKHMCVNLCLYLTAVVVTIYS